MAQPLFAFTVGKIRPRPGIDPADVELPGPGLYEADYRVPEWVSQILGGLGVSDFNFEREFTVPFVNGLRMEHISTRWRGTLVTIRARLVETELRPAGPELQSGAATVGRFTMTVLRHPNFKLVVSLGIVSAIVKGLVEVRKLAEIGGGSVLLAGGGIALAGLGLTRIRGG